MRKKQVFAFLFLFLVCLLPLGIASGVSAYETKNFSSFCMGKQELSGNIKSYLDTNATSQGMCIADHYLIYTIYENDWSSTAYVVYDMKKKQEVNRQYFHTLHSNSLTYNPDAKEVVCVTEGHAYVFSFQDGELQLLDDIYTSHNFPKIAYSSAAGAYYLATDTDVYRSTDLVNVSRVFGTETMGVNQGMAAEGDYLYVIWYQVGYNRIAQYNLSGSLEKVYTLSSDELREVEEIDFLDDAMYLNINNSGSDNGIYKVASDHELSKWETLQKADCIHVGYKRRVCSRCGEEEVKEIPLTGVHDSTGWVVKKEATCTRDGYRVKTCKVCHKVLKKETLEKLGHDYGSYSLYQEATVYQEGVYKRVCERCHKAETSTIPKLTPEIDSTYKVVNINIFGTAKLDMSDFELQKGDQVASFQADNQNLIHIDTQGNVTALQGCSLKNALTFLNVLFHPSKKTTTVTVQSEAGASREFRVKVHILPDWQQKVCELTRKILNHNDNGVTSLSGLFRKLDIRTHIAEISQQVVIDYIRNHYQREFMVER